MATHYFYPLLHDNTVPSGKPNVQRQFSALFYISRYFEDKFIFDFYIIAMSRRAAYRKRYNYQPAISGENNDRQRRGGASATGGVAER
ncbi:hypothetical protein [Franconibacter helveticus]|uniref:hypothetical protein n=1 Tax=Franconibacter helveticus TaxID=357240 RepID=UPI0029077E40|nr:hypothetical protein [Franconibacter helveticus]MDU6925571.1 hypothetical protein [Franconibacter helveticus]